MLSETIVSAFLETSITGAGLVLAVYALVTPISEKIFTKRADKLRHLLDDFEKEKSKITADAPNRDFKHLKELRDNIEEINFSQILELWNFGNILYLRDFSHNRYCLAFKQKQSSA